MDAIKNNPAIVTGAVRLIALALVILGLRTLSPEEELALVTVITVVMSIITSKVTVPKNPTTEAPDKSIQEQPAG